MVSLNKTAWPWTSQREHVRCLQHSAVTCETGNKGPVSLGISDVWLGVELLMASGSLAYREAALFFLVFGSRC